MKKRAEKGPSLKKYYFLGKISTRENQKTTRLRVVTCIVSAIVVSITDPDTRDALVVAALELVLGTDLGRAVHLVLTSGAVDVVVALLVGRDAEPGHGPVPSALELLAQASVVVTVLINKRILIISSM